MIVPRPERIAPYVFEIAADRAAGHPAPARVFADDVLMERMLTEHCLEQLLNVTCLPGLWGAAYGMPDMHEGYGFPVGGVAGTVLPDGVISPGGIGFDINCGVRLLASSLTRRTAQSQIEPVLHELMRGVPHGYGRGGRFGLDDAALERVLAEGAAYLVRERGMGSEDDLEHTESRGRLEGADPAQVSARARTRGRDQLGTLGGGNHFLEILAVDQIFEQAAAERFGLFADQIVVLIHTGSRGLGHQVCTDHVLLMDQAMARHGITVPDRQLACAPLSSPEGRGYFGAMCAAANFAWGNRLLITELVRGAFARMLGPGHTLRTVYDVGHNTARVERFGERTLCVHRKGATRALGPSATELPVAYRGIGQPVFIPGSMGTASYVLAGTDEAAELSLASTCHGAGRTLSRGAAKRQVAGHELRRELAARGIVVRCPSNVELAEEAPLAYKDVDRVVEVVHGAGLARKVARLVPLGVLKG